MPTVASPTKVARLKSYGAVVHQVGAVYAEARAASEKRAAETGALIVPAYEDAVVFAGAGSVALEFAEQATFDTLLVAVGGGGLIAGCAAAIGAAHEDRRGRDRGHADAATRRAAPAGRSRWRSPASPPMRWAPAASARPISRSPRSWCAMRCWSATTPCAPRSARCGKSCASIAEPAGATGLAALMAGAYKPAPGERVATLVCGANTDPGSVV